jgi:glycosyltransferase involved in cell wall biosynthesis
MTIVEAFGCGTPVLASGIGSLDELVTEGVNGYKFPAQNPEALAACVHSAITAPQKLYDMRSAARLEYEKKYSPEQNYRSLTRIYEVAASKCRSAVRNTSTAA